MNTHLRFFRFSRTTRKISIVVSAAIVCLLSLAAYGVARGASITVDTTNDELNSDGDCSLREAVAAAETNAAVDACAAGSSFDTDYIAVPAGTYVLDFGDDLILSDNSSAAEDTHITGAGVATTIIQQSGGGRVLTNNSGRAYLNALTLSGGDSPSEPGGGIYNAASAELTLDTVAVSNNTTAVYGGGIANSGTTTIDASTVSGNHSNADGGGINNSGTLIVRNGSVIGGAGSANNTAASGNGGGIYSSGSVSIETRSEITGNRAGRDGIGIYGTENSTVTVDASMIHSNTGLPTSIGGGIFSKGDLTVRNGSDIANNSAGYAGGIYSEGTVTMDDSNVTANHSGSGVGGIASLNQAIIRNSSINQNSGSSKGGGIFGAGSVTISDSTINENISTFYGGGIYLWYGTMSITNSHVNGNSAPSKGGGMYLGDDDISVGGTVTVDASTFDNNTANAEGGGIRVGEDMSLLMEGDSSLSGNYGVEGAGAILIEGTSSAVTLDSTTVSDNYTFSFGGAGIRVKSDGTLTVRNGSLISGNLISDDASGGGIYNEGSTTITDSILRSNATGFANGNSGGGIMTVAGSVSVTGSCIVGNQPASLDNTAAPQQIATGNWWGASTGANTTGADTTAGNWDTSGFLTTPPFDGCSDGLTVLGDGAGDGTMTSATPSGEIACVSTGGTESGDCDSWKIAGTTTAYSVVAAPTASTFTGWTGCDSTSTTNIADDTCHVTVDDTNNQRTITASFEGDPELTVLGGGTGSGTMAATGIACNSTAAATSGDCTEIAASNTVFAIVAAPEDDSDFGGWSGSCDNITTTNETDDTCNVTLTGSTTVTATFNTEPTLYIEGDGNGNGTIAATGISCTSTAGIESGDCEEQTSAGTSFTLVAVPDVASAFDGWSGNCDSITTTTLPGDTCNISVTGDIMIAVSFSPLPALTVNGFGSSTGTMVGSGISCAWDGFATSGTCTGTGASYAIVATNTGPSGSSRFSGWIGCDTVSTTVSFEDTCNITPTVDTPVTASFDLTSTLAVFGDGTGAGTVTSSTLGIACDIDAGATSGPCASILPVGSLYALVAEASPGSVFSSWTGCDFTGTTNIVGDTCIGVTSLTDTPVTASFTLIPKPDLTISKINDVSGAVEYPAGWNWQIIVTNNGSGAATFNSGDVILRDELPAGVTATYIGGGGNLMGGTGGVSCTVTGDPAVLTCTAVSGTVIFQQNGSFVTMAFTITPSAPGSYTNPDGGVCRADPDNLAAEVSETNNDCVPNTVTVAPPPTLTVSADGDGSGTMTDASNSIACISTTGVESGTCTHTASSGTPYAIIAAADPGSTFVSWSNCDNTSGTGGSVCEIAPNANAEVIANFSQDCYALTLNSLPPAGGSVDADPDPNCGTGGYRYSTVVTLTETPSTGYTFDAWGGDISGLGSTLAVTMNGPLSIDAHFIINCYVVTFAVNPPAGGSVNVPPPAGGCYDYGTNLSVQAVANPGYFFTGWSGGLSGIANPASYTVTGPALITANFSPCLLVNCSFESPSGANHFADGWKRGGIKLPGDGTDTSVMTDGLQSFRFANPKAKAKKLYQDVVLSAPANTNFNLTFSWRGDNVTGKKGLFRVMVIVYYTKGGSSKFYVNMPVGINDWTYYSLSFAAKKIVKKIRVEIDYGKKGAAWFDDFHLTIP